MLQSHTELTMTSISKVLRTMSLVYVADQPNDEDAQSSNVNHEAETGKSRSIVHFA